MHEDCERNAREPAFADRREVWLGILVDIALDQEKPDAEPRDSSPCCSCGSPQPGKSQEEKPQARHT